MHCQIIFDPKIILSDHMETILNIQKPGCHIGRLPARVNQRYSVLGVGKVHGSHKLLEKKKISIRKYLGQEELGRAVF